MIAESCHAQDIITRLYSHAVELHSTLCNRCSTSSNPHFFSKYRTFAKAKVIRDAKSHKSKGYGFVSFTEAMDALAAMKEVDGTYIGNRPVRIKRSTWAEKDTTEVKRRERDASMRAHGKK